MPLTARAEAMLSTLPAYYRGEPLLERIIQAQANEIDRLDALVDKLMVELQPGAATDDLGLLAIWEAHLDLPSRPEDATLGQRQAKVRAALRALGAVTAIESLDILAAAIGSTSFTITRDDPGILQDTLEVPFDSTSYNAGVVARIARRLWPAHRQLFISYAGGFLFDTTIFDEASA
jgi:uncharacterized protein YmfQ (DUF2313 family)